MNRAARIMKAAHGGQILLSRAVVDYVRDRLPAAVSLRDLGAVRLRDLATSEHVYQRLHPPFRQDFPALRSLEATPNNLPQQVTSFVGRQRELAEAKEMLDGRRLPTLLGMGGLGKMRLSLQIAADVLERYPDGVWFIDLAPTKDPALVPNAAAQARGVHEEPGKPLVQTLCAHVKEHKALLVLDNCESPRARVSPMRCSYMLLKYGSSRPAGRLCAFAGSRPTPCGRWRCRAAMPMPRAFSGRKPFSFSSSARDCRSRASR